MSPEVFGSLDVMSFIEFFAKSIFHNFAVTEGNKDGQGYTYLSDCF